MTLLFVIYYSKEIYFIGIINKMEIVVAVYNLQQRIPLEIVKEYIIPNLILLSCLNCSTVLQTTSGLKKRKAVAWVHCPTIKYKYWCLKCFEKKYSFRSRRLDIN
jgi:hypothetical protein